MKLVGLLLTLAMVLTAPSAEAAACLRSNTAGAIAEGRLSLGQFEDAAGRAEQAFILTLSTPTCLSGEDDMDNVDDVETIHVFALDDALQAGLKRFVGKDVQVRGTPIPAHTAHHHAPIVMSVAEIDEF
jgi:hypothetical protein